MSQFNIIENKLKTITRGSIIPHPGKIYGGDARKNSFRFFKKNVKFILYIAALHRLSFNKNGVIYVLNKDNGFPDYFDNQNLDLKYDLDIAARKEHSFKWVEEELRDYFSDDTKVLVLAPSINTNLDNLGEIIYNFLNIYENSIIFATSDLIHYGSNFDTENLLKYPQQQDKIKKENRLIYNLKNVKLKNVKSIIAKHDYICCGPKALILFCIVAKKMKWIGKVTDYYDSHGKMKSQLLDRYTIDYKNVDNLVSYVSMIYGKYNDFNPLIEFDILQGIGLSKSIIMRNTIFNDDSIYKINLPVWSLLRSKNRNNGIFVGTEFFDKEKKIFNTNCSYGRFEDGETSISNKIIRASNDCNGDAKNRWNIPYEKKNLNMMTYKLELLDEKKNWKKYKAKDVYKYFKLNGRYGMLLKIPPTKYNNNWTSATFLPVVARDYKSIWEISDYMENLSEKQGKNKNDWKLDGSEILIYKSGSYIWKLHKLIFK